LLERDLHVSLIHRAIGVQSCSPPLLQHPNRPPLRHTNQPTNQLTQPDLHKPDQIAVQVALVVAKIARSDFPREWPALVSDLLSKANGGSTLTVGGSALRLAGLRRG